MNLKEAKTSSCKAKYNIEPANTSKKKTLVTWAEAICVIKTVQHIPEAYTRVMLAAHHIFPCACPSKMSQNAAQ